MITNVYFWLSLFFVCLSNVSTSNDCFERNANSNCLKYFDPIEHLHNYTLLPSTVGLGVVGKSFEFHCGVENYDDWFSVDHFGVSHALNCDHSCEHCRFCELELGFAGLYYCTNTTHAMYLELSVMTDIQCKSEGVNLKYAGFWAPEILTFSEQTYHKFIYRHRQYYGLLKDLDKEIHTDIICNYT